MKKCSLFVVIKILTFDSQLNKTSDYLFGIRINPKTDKKTETGLCQKKFSVKNIFHPMKGIIFNNQNINKKKDYLKRLLKPLHINF